MVQYLLSKGANPLKMNKQGQDFRQILQSQMGRTSLTQHSIVEKVEQLIYPNQTKQTPKPTPKPKQEPTATKKNYPKWQFWRRF